MGFEPGVEPLNHREIEILTLIADGLSNREIAQKLHLAPETIKWHNKHIFAKLGADSRTQAVSIAKRAQVLNNPLPLGAPPLPAKNVVSLLHHLARGQMVGRVSEITQLQQRWAQALQGHGRLALLSGEPGIGKTRLANELVAYAQLSGAAILHGGCYEYEATTPYLPFVEALREWVHQQDGAAVRALIGSTAGELVRLAPEIESKMGRVPPNPTLTASEERLRLFDNVTRFLQNLAKERGLLLFIDDLHWADQSSLSLLAYVIRNLRNERVLILAAYREAELDRKHPLAAALVEWNRERIATRITVGRLTLEETSTLLAALFEQESISEELARAVYRETEGNPFFIEEVVKALIEQGQIYRENNRWERKEVSELAIPQSVKEAIGRRLNRLSESTLEVLHAAAALGKDFEYAELAAIELMSEDRLLDALDEASTAQLVQVKNGEGYAFTHDKIREVLYEEINPIRRKRLHQRIGEALEAQFRQGNQAYTQELAYHYTEGGDLARSLRFSILAAEKASRLFALDDAIYYYEIALEAAERLGQSERLASIYTSTGEIYSQRGQVNQSVQAFQRAMALQEDPEECGAIKARMGSVYASAGDARGLALIEEALQELNPVTQADEVALATAMIGRYYHYRCLHWQAIEYLERARLIAEPLGHPDTVGQIYAFLAGAHQHLTRFADSMAWAWKNVELGRQKNNPINESFGYEFLAEDYSALGDWAATLQYANRDREIGETIGAQDRVAWGTYCQAVAKHGLGNLASAEKDARATRLLSENIGDTRLRILAGGIIVQILSDLGRAEEAGELGEQVLQEADELQHAYLQMIARHCNAYSLLLQDQTERALELYLQAEQLAGSTENLWMPMNYQPWLAQALFDAHRIEEARKMMDHSLRLARNAGARFDEALALRVEAQLLAARGGWEAALSSAKDSIDILEQTGSRLEVGRSILFRGQIQHKRGDPPAARADWVQAEEIFTSLGALPAAQKARKLLREIEP